MRIISFGTGKYYQNRKNELLSSSEIMAFIDNNKKIQGGYLDGKPIVSPNSVNQFSYDKILLMSVKADEMKRQLLEIGIEESKIWYWEQFKSEKVHGTFKLYLGKRNFIKKGKKVLIISTDLNYNGGSLAAIYAAMAIQNKENFVVLAACSGNHQLINEIEKSEINLVICPALPYLYQEELFFIQQFDIILVNVFQMIPCACEISKEKPVMWWIHEPKELYSSNVIRYDKYMSVDKMRYLNIYAVSHIAQKNFNHYLPNRIENLLAYGIPDKWNNSIHKKQIQKLVFAIIGIVHVRKAQDIFLDAIKKMDDCDKMNAEFWIIGAVGKNEYCDEILETASQEPAVKILGELTRSQLNDLYQDIDVVVCPSREETMSIVVTEGMMYGKVCIVSDNTGMADYISDGENGFICKSENATELSERMKWVIRNRGKLQKIRLNARHTYEEFFTLESFGERLEQALVDTLEQYGKH